MVVYYHEAECHAEKLVQYRKSQGHSEGLYDQNMIIFTVSFLYTTGPFPTKLALIAQHQMPLFPTEKKQPLITAFKVKVTVKIQNVSDCPDNIF